MRFVAGQRVSDLPEVAAPGSEIAGWSAVRCPLLHKEKQRKAECAKRRSGPSPDHSARETDERPDA